MRSRAKWVKFPSTSVEAGTFENHDHLQKRTKLLKTGVDDPDLRPIEDPAGTLYLGDGAMGRERGGLRSPNGESYISATAEEYHFWSVTIDGPTATYVAIDEDGDEIDRVVTDEKRYP